jgi:predicted Zn-dependent protease
MPRGILVERQRATEELPHVFRIPSSIGRRRIQLPGLTVALAVICSLDFAYWVDAQTPQVPGRRSQKAAGKVAHADPNQNAAGLPGFPNFGDFNPFERFFGRPDPEDWERLRNVAITVREEQQYGERVLDAMRQNFKQREIELASRGADVAYVQALVDGLRPSMRHSERYRSLRVLVAETDETDAYSIPGGTIIVYRGMLEFAGSEAALVGVLGHELSHLDHRHQLVPLQRNKLLQSPGGRGSAFSLDQMMRQTSLLVSNFMRPFRPEDEAEADRDGAVWAYRAGYDPRRMAQLFARLHARDQFGAAVPSFLRTHPYHADRQRAVEVVHAELQQSDPRDRLYVGSENLRRRIPMSSHKFEE